MFGYSEAFLDDCIGYDSATDFICLTDDKTLKSDFWTVVQAPHSLLDPHRRAKIIKHNPHLFFPDHDASLYFDNTIRITKHPDEIFSLLDDSPAPLHMFRHPFRDCIYDEAAAVIDVKFDDPLIIERQMSFYRAMNYPAHNGLNATGFLLRRHHDPALSHAMTEWSQQMLMYSKRDQLSFNVIRHVHKLEVNELPGDIQHTDLLQWPADAGAVRLPRDFDEAEYLALHPDVARSDVNPRKHYLQHGIREGRAYKRG